MKIIAFFDTKPYDREFFDKANDALPGSERFELRYFEGRLNPGTAALADGCDAVCGFVNDEVSAGVLDRFYENGIGIIAMRCAGYNNVDMRGAWQRVHVVRVPAYSPYAVAEHASALLLALNRKLHRAYNRTREHNFSLEGLIGHDLHGKTAGIIGMGRIGRVFADICRGFGMKIVAYDPFPAPADGVEFVSVEKLCGASDIISLHCPLTNETHHLINDGTIKLMRDGVLLINTSRGALVDSESLMRGLKSGRIGGAGLDVYEEESELFFTDLSDRVLRDDRLAALISMPNVILTSHQGFFTREAMQAIAGTTLDNLRAFFAGEVLGNEICYRCEDKSSTCDRSHEKNCF